MRTRKTWRPGGEVRPAGRRERRRRVAITAVAALAAVAAVGVVAVRGHWFDPARRATEAELDRIGAPEGFRPVPAPDGADAVTYRAEGSVASREYAGGLVSEEVAPAIDAWLRRAGYDRSSGADSCELVVSSTFSGLECGNFLRTDGTWRVWVGFASHDRDDELRVHVQPVLAGDDAFAVQTDWGRAEHGPAEEGEAVFRSPGIAATAARGEARLVLDDPDVGRALSAASFTPDGDLLLVSGLLQDLAPPQLLPAEAGEPLRRFAVDAWPSLPEERVTPDVPSRAMYGLRGVRRTSDGSLWFYGADGLRVLRPDGTTDNLMGGGPRRVVEGGEALGQSPYAGEVGYGSDLFAVTDDGTTWIPLGKDGLIRVTEGRVHRVSAAAAEVVAAAPDGSVYFADAATIHRVAPDGTVAVVGGAGATATEGWDHDFEGISSIAAGDDRTVWVLDGGRLLRLDADGLATHVAGAPTDGDEACEGPVPAAAKEMVIDDAYSVIVRPGGGVFLTGCDRLVEIGAG